MLLVDLSHEEVCGNVSVDRAEAEGVLAVEDFRAFGVDATAGTEET